jgi:hypothetical protein
MNEGLRNCCTNLQFYVLYNNTPACLSDVVYCMLCTAWSPLTGESSIGVCVYEVGVKWGSM